MPNTTIPTIPADDCSNVEWRRYRMALAHVAQPYVAKQLLNVDPSRRGWYVVSNRPNGPVAIRRCDTKIQAQSLAMRMNRTA